MLHVASVTMGPASSGQIDDISRSQAFQRRGTDAQSVTQLMTQHLDLAQPRTDAEALRLLRQAFPAAPLAARVAAMAGRPR